MPGTSAQINVKCRKWIFHDKDLCSYILHNLPFILRQLKIKLPLSDVSHFSEV